jgi:hypothetical protein
MGYRGRASVIGMLLVWSASPLVSQQTVDTTRVKRDSIAADSARLARELERRMAGNSPATQQPRVGGQAGSTNPRLLPDFSAVGDLVGDLSPRGSTLSDRNKRADVREVELAVQAAVDPFFRGDVFLGISDEEKISIEQAFLTTTALPWQLEARIGRYLMPVGKINLTHRHDLHTVEYPWMEQRFLSDDGLKGTGIWALRVFSPFGFYQELNVAAVDRFGEAPEDLVTASPVNQRLSGIGYAARLRNYIDINQSTNIEFSGSFMTGEREQPISGSLTASDGRELNAVQARQSLFGGDLTFRWRPLQQGLYKSFILQAEVMRQVNEKSPVLPANGIAYLGPTRNLTGAYVFGRYQLRQRSFLGARYDYVQTADPGTFTNLRALSGDVEFFPSEFSKLVVSFEHLFGGGLESGFVADNLNRILVQASFALGPHKPHPF